MATMTKLHSRTDEGSAGGLVQQEGRGDAPTYEVVSTAANREVLLILRGRLYNLLSRCLAQKIQAQEG